MRWGEHSLYWGRPLKSILAIFDSKPLKFQFHHLISSNSTFIDKDFEENITSHLRSFENLGNEEFQLTRKNNEQATIKIISGIFSSASEKQIRGMSRRIETYIASIDRILSNRSLD